MKKEKFSIEGSIALKEAFVEECGIPLHELVEDMLENYNYIFSAAPTSKKYLGVSNLKSPVHFKLPQDYNKALKYVKEYFKEEAEFKAGDVVTDDGGKNLYKYKEYKNNRHYPECYFPNNNLEHKDLSFGRNLRKATEEEILEHLKKEFISRTGIDVGSKIKQKSVFGESYLYNKVTEFVLHNRNNLNGKNSAFTDQWFKDNPDERYQLGIACKAGMYSPYCELIETMPDIIINGYKGEFFDDYVKFGCAEIDKDIFIDLSKYTTLNIGNRLIESVKIGAGTFNNEQIREIANYYLNKNE